MPNPFKVIYYINETLVASSNVERVILQDDGEVTCITSGQPLRSFYVTRKNLAKEAIIEGTKTGVIDLSAATREA